jgi:signal transduction histidine kinase
VAVLGPLFLAFVQTAGTFGAAQGQPGRRSPDVLAVVIVLAGPAALLVVRRHPVQVLAWITTITAVYLVRGYPYGPVLISMVAAVFINVILNHRTAAWIAMAALCVAHFGLRGLFEDRGWSWGEVAGVGAWALLNLTAAEFARVRRERAIAAHSVRAEARKRRANEERLRIARELHDVVAHHMSLINVQAGVALHLMGEQPEQAETALVAIKSASKEALSELRTLVGVLREDGEAAPRSPASMLGSLDDLVERSGYAGLKVEKRITGLENPLPATVELAAFRIVQEAITNVVRHAGATSATIAIDHGERELTVQVDDDGNGFRPAAEVAGNGILGMRERAQALGGSLDVTAGQSGGARVRAVFPLEPSPSEESS